MGDENQINVKHQHYGVYGRIKKAITFSNRFKQSPPSAQPINVPKVSKSKIKFSEPGPRDLKNEHGGNDRISDYIKRVKTKMRRSITVVGGGGGKGDGGKGGSRLESINKMTSSYIDRAKVKMRTASIVGFGKKTK